MKFFGFLRQRRRQPKPEPAPKASSPRPYAIESVEMEELTKRGCQMWDDLLPILEEHLPDELKDRARRLVDDLQGNCFDMSFIQLAEVYRALIALLPDHYPQIRAAYQATVFAGDRNDEADWEKFKWEGLAKWPQRERW